MLAPRYIDWFVAESGITLKNDVPITCYKLAYKIEEEALDEWALHIRRHYESDDELTESLSVTGISAEEYLRRYVVPQKSEPFGPSARSNDFTEIMISDLLEFIHGYTVPRCKQHNRSGKNNSEHGTDILAYRFYISPQKPDPKDELVASEVKAELSSDTFGPIDKAIEDSQKYDVVRYAHTLNYYRKKLESQQKLQQAEEIARFQQKSEYDYVLTYIAAAVISRENISSPISVSVDEQNLTLQSHQHIFLVHGKSLMSLANQIYERCIR